MKQDMSYLKFIVSSLRNKPGRNLATVFCFAFIALNIFSGQILMAGAEGGVSRGISRMGADQIVVPAQYLVFLRGSSQNTTMTIVRAESSTFRINLSIMDTVGKVTGVSQMSPQLYVTTLNQPGLSPVPVDIFGIDPVTDFTIQPWLRQPLDEPLEPGEVMAGSGIVGDTGSKLSLFGHSYTVAGKLDPTQSSADHTIFLRLDDAYALAAEKGVIPPSAPRVLPGDVNALLIRDAPGEDSVAVFSGIRRSLSSSYPPSYVSVIGRNFALDPVSENIQDVPDILNSISAFVVIAALPLIALIAAMVTHERQREIGLLMSMGAKRNVIFFLVMAESLVLAAVGGIAGVGAGLGAFYLLNMQGALSGALQVTFAMPSISVIGRIAGMALLVVIFIGSISSFWPAYRSSTMNPYDAIRSEAA
jgi:putative ABC transport system permease protein